MLNVMNDNPTFSKNDYKQITKRGRLIGAWVPPSWVKRFDAMVNVTQRSPSSLIREALARAIMHWEKKGK